MQVARAIAAAMALTACAMVITGSGAAARTAPTSGGMREGIDLSTPAAAKRYLSSLGIDPATVVVQRGARNYVGPHCPGRGWNCTTAHRVLQIGPAARSSSRSLAARAAVNQGECTPTVPTETSTTQSCTIMQAGTTNSARCVEKSDAPDMAQSCVITQTGTSNDAFVLQDISTGASFTVVSTKTQRSTQTTQVTQNGVDNRLDATQRVNQSLTGAVTQQDAHLFIDVCQGGTRSGDTCIPSPNDGTNISKIHQQRYTDAHGSGAGVSQKQDTTANGDCSPTTPPNAPNLCANVEQFSNTRNDNDLHQEDHLRATATATVGAVTQVQGTQPVFPDFLQDGIDGHVVQPVSGNAVNTNVSHLHLTYDLSGPSGAGQSQDPGLGCCSPQAGTGQSSSNIHEVSILKADKGADQHSTESGECLSNGSCLVLSHAKINGSQATDRCTDQAAGESPAFCTTTVECDSETGCTTVIPDVDLASLGFDMLDFQSAINFVFPLTLPVSPL